MKIHEIPENIQIAIENLVDPETGECKTPEQVDKLCRQLQGSFIDGMTYFSKLVVNMTYENKMLKEHRSGIDKRIKANEKRIESLKNYIGYCLHGEKFKTEDGLVSVSYRRNSDVLKIDALADIPDEYFKAPHDEQHLMKTAIKEAIQDGVVVDGVHLEDTVSVVIRG